VAPVANLVWNGGASGLWSYDTANTVWLDGSTSISFVAGSIANVNSAASLVIDSAGVTAGALTNNIFSGTTTITGGNLTSGSIVNAGAGNLDLQVTNSASTLANNGTGILSLSAPGTYATVNVTNGTILALTNEALSGLVNVSDGGTLNVSATSSNTIGVLTVSNGVVIGTGILTGSGSSFTLDSSDQTVPVSIRGSGNLTKSGSRTLTLSGANTFSGDVNLNVGNLATSGDDRLPDTTIVVMSANTILSLGGNETIKSLYASSANASAQVNLQSYILTMNVTASNQFVGSLVGSGSMVKNGSSILTLTNTSTYTGGTTMNAGSFRLQASGNKTINVDANTVALTTSPFGVGALNWAGGAIYSSSLNSRSIYNAVNLLGGTNTLGDTNSTTGTGDMIVSADVTGVSTTLNASCTVNAAAAVDWEQPIIGPSFNLIKDGTNTLTLWGTNNLNALSVNAGSLTIRNSNNINTIAVGNGGTFLSRSNGGSIGQINVSQGGVLSYRTTNAAFGTAVINLSNGTLGQSAFMGLDANLPAVADRLLPNKLNILNNVTLGLGNYANYLGGNVDLNGQARTLTLGNSTYLYGAVTNGGLVVDRVITDLNSTKTLGLYGANTYSGGTRVVGVAGLTTNNPSLYLAHDNALGTGDLTLEGGGDLLVKAISPNSNFADATRLITNAVVISSGVKGLFDAGSTSVVPLDGSSATTVINLMTLSGAISGAGSFEKTNDGVVTLRGTLTYSGGTVVSGGTLKIQKTGLTADITTNTIAISFNPAPSAGTIQVLPGALVGIYEPASFSGLAVGQTATFTQSSGEVVVTQAALTPTITVTPAVGGYTYVGSMQGPGVSEVSTGGSTGEVTLSYAGTGSTSYGSSSTPPTSAGTYTVTATVAADSTYNQASSTPTAFTIAKATPTVSVAPTASAVTVGALLSSSTLSGGTASVAGTFAWTTSSTVVNATASYPVTFTPTDGANYNTASSTASVTANPVGTTFGSWSGNAVVTQDLVSRYAFGAADKNSAPQKLSSSITSTTLSVTAVVRTDDTHLVITPKSVTSLSGAWSATEPVISVVNAADQTGLGAGLVRKTFSVERGIASNRFLKLEAVYTP